MAPEGLSAGLPRTERIRRILDRDGHECVWCRRPLVPGDRDLSFEHVIPRLKGGPSWIENEVAACRACNRRRGHLAASAFLAACEQRGLRPNRAAIEHALRRLEEAIGARGGARKARPHLQRELRRLA